MQRSILAFFCFLAIAAPASGLELASPDLRDGKAMPNDFIYPRCGGKNVSPPLRWSGVPQNAQSLALTLIDTSVRPSGWSHWIVIDMSRDTTGLSRGTAELPPGAISPKSNFGDAHYDGPCPPPGSGLHRYRITLWALKKSPDVHPDERADILLAALKRDSLASATLEVTVFAARR